MTVSKDTIIKGINCKKITGPYSLSKPGYMYKSNDSVYYSIHNDLSDLKYLYSFDMIVGQIMAPTGYASWTVDSIKTMTIASFPRKVFYLAKVCSYSSYPPYITLIENIGPLEAYLFWTPQYTCSFIVNDTDPYYDLYCFNDTQGSYPENCIPQVSRIKKSANPTFAIYPNPADAEMEIDLANNSVDKIEISDMKGVLHHTEKINAGLKFSIGTAHLRNGLYLVKLYSNSMPVAVQKLFIRH
jgi:hypothetical protein